MKKYLAAVLVLSCGVLTACGSEEIKTVDYYAKNLDEAKSIKAECKEDASNLSENCKNAMVAIDKARLKSRNYGKKVEPMEF